MIQKIEEIIPINEDSLIPGNDGGSDIHDNFWQLAEKINEIISVLNSLTEKKKCKKENGYMVCYCGKCEPDSYPLPKDFLKFVPHTPQEEKGEAWEERLRLSVRFDRNQDREVCILLIKNLLSTTAEKARAEERERNNLLIEKFGKEPITKSSGTYEDGYQDCFQEFRSAIIKN